MKVLFQPDVNYRSELTISISLYRANTSGANSSGSGAESTNNASSAGGSGTQKASNMASFESNVVCFGKYAYRCGVKI